MFPEYFSKIAACPQTAVMGNLCNRSLCFYQFHTCFSKSVFSHIFQWTHMKFFLKQSKTGSLTDMCFLCKLLDQYRLRVMLLNIEHIIAFIFSSVSLFLCISSVSEPAISKRPSHTSVSSCRRVISYPQLPSSRSKPAHIFCKSAACPGFSGERQIISSPDLYIYQTPRRSKYRENP